MEILFEVKEGNIFDVKVRSLAFGGYGIAKVEGQVCFIPGVIPGEIVKIKVKSIKKNHFTAIALELIEASPDRVEPVCPWAAKPTGDGRIKPSVCPGCSYQHISYPAELKIKQQQFMELFTHTGGLEDVNFLEPLASPCELGYRNKITLHTELDEGVMRLGYFMDDNHSVLEIASCPLASAGINKLLEEVSAQNGFRHSLHQRMTATFRETAHEGALFWRNNPPSRMSWLKEETPAGTISVPAESFFQVNPDAGAILINTTAAMIEQLKPDTVIDLYCGTGVFGCVAAQHGVKNIFGIDNDGPAITAAEFNLKKHGAVNFELLAGKAGKLFSSLKGKYAPENTTLIVDPPRTGIEKPALQHLCTTGIKDVIYISCGPDTLCRDLAIMLRNGYSIVSTQLVDMFPRTAHFESITLLTRDNE